MYCIFQILYIKCRSFQFSWGQKLAHIRILWTSKRKNNHFCVDFCGVKLLLCNFSQMGQKFCWQKHKEFFKLSFESDIILKKISIYVLLGLKKNLLPLIWIVKSPEILVHPSKSLKLSKVRIVFPGHSLEQSAHSCYK